MKPEVRTAKTATPTYLRELVEKAGISQREAARRLDVSDRTMRAWLAGAAPCPYTAQFCMEVLAANPEPIRE